MAAGVWLAAVTGASAGCDAGALCAAGPCTITGTHQVDEACVLDFDAIGVTALTVAGTLEAAAGAGFTVKAARLDGAGTLRAPSGRVTVQTTEPTGALDFAGTVDVRPGGAAILYGAGPVTLDGEVTADGTTGPHAGTIEISGTSVTLDGGVYANGGTNGRGGRLTVTSRTGAVTATAGSALSASGGGTAADAGTIEIRAGTTLELQGSVLAEGGGTGDGGTIHIAAGGAFTADGTLHARASGAASQADGGEITLLATAATITGALRASGLGSGDGGSIRVKLTSGDFALTGGTIDVGSGSEGHAGALAIVAPADVALGGAITANASGATSRGGAITVQAGGVLTVTAPVEARSTTTGGAQEEALVELTACTLDIRAPIATRSGSGSGEARFYYTQGMAVSNTSLTADDAGTLTVACACLDADQDGTCEAPLRCRTEPVWTNVTSTPEVQISPEYPTVCG
jgi:hypothetical protein